MAYTDFDFADRDALIDFLWDGDSALIADYLDHNHQDMAAFFKNVSGHSIDIRILSTVLRSDNDNNIRECRNFIAGCLDRGADQLPLPKTEPIEPQTTAKRPKQSVLSKISAMRWPLPVTVAAASIAASAFFIDLNDIKEYFSPHNDSTLSEPVADLSGSFNEGPTITPGQPELDAIDDAVQEALNPPMHGYAQSAEFDSHGVEGLYQDTSGTIFYQDWEVPNDVYEANILTAQITGLPLTYMFAAQATESAVNGVIDPNATNSMRTCGLAQFVPSTLAEYSYNYAELIGFDGIRDDLVVRTRTRLEEDLPNGDPSYHLSYNFSDPMAHHAVEQICFDPHFNTRLGGIMKLRDIGIMQRNLADLAPEGSDFFPVTELQAYVALFAGRTGAEELIEDLVNNGGDAPVTNFFSAVARSNTINQQILYHSKTITNSEGEEVTVPDRENPRTVAEFFENLEETRPLTNTVLPDFTDWSSIQAEIATNMADLDRITVRVTSPRPVARPPRAERYAEYN